MTILVSYPALLGDKYFIKLEIEFSIGGTTWKYPEIKKKKLNLVQVEGVIIKI